MIQVSEKAKLKAIELMREDGYDASIDFIRVGVKSGGCSGLSYELTFDKEEKESDKVFENNNIKIVVEKKAFYTSWARNWIIQGVSMVQALSLKIQMLTEPAGVAKAFHFNFIEFT